MENGERIVWAGERVCTLYKQVCTGGVLSDFF